MIHVPLAEINFGEFLLLVFEWFLLFAWIWIVITILLDLFRDHQLSGIAKAVWAFFLIFIPFFGVLLYLIVRGGGMRDRTLKEQADAKQHFDSYVREQAHTSPADELHKLAELKDKGALSAEEFDKAKANVYSQETQRLYAVAEEHARAIRIGLWRDAQGPRDGAATLTR